MNESDLESFKTWMEAQPDHCSYTRVRNFLADYLDTSKAAAEVEMAEMADSQIKIIQKKSGNSGRRVFLLPLDPLSESDIRAVWNGSASVGKDANRIATNVHDNTGHDIGDIINFMADLEIATLENGTFKWKNL